MAPKEWASVTNPALWIVATIALLTLALYALPASWLPFSSAAVTRVHPPPEATPTPVALPAPAAAVPVAASAPASAPVPTEVAASGAPAVEAPAALTEPDAVTAAAASGVLQFSASAQSWVEVTDARGQSLIARVLEPGESVGLDGVMPLKVRIGNAAATQLVFRGQPLALASYTRDNVARLELK